MQHLWFNKKWQCMEKTKNVKNHNARKIVNTRFRKKLQIFIATKNNWYWEYEKNTTTELYNINKNWIKKIIANFTCHEKIAKDRFYENCKNSSSRKVAQFRYQK